LVSLEQYPKQLSRIVIAEGGMQIGVAETRRENATVPNRISFKSSSNVTLERSPQEAMQRSKICSTDEGMQIDLTEEHL
jgi:hypothetical protein